MFRGSWQRPTSIFVCLAAVVLLWHYLGWFIPVETRLRAWLVPILKSSRGFNVKLANSYRWFSSRNEFIEAATECFAANRAIIVTKAELTSARDEIKQLRGLLKFTASQSAPPVLAEIIGRSMNASAQTVIINVGTNNGIRSGEAVIYEQGILLGKIVKTAPNIAWVTLLNDPHSRVAAQILNDTKSPGVVEGGFGLSLRMQFIPRNDNVAIGTPVVTAGFENFVPAGLLIGTVAATENEAYKPFQQAVITPLVNISNISAVAVIKSSATTSYEINPLR